MKILIAGTETNCWMFKELLALLQYKDVEILNIKDTEQFTAQLKTATHLITGYRVPANFQAFSGLHLASIAKGQNRKLKIAMVSSLQVSWEFEGSIDCFHDKTKSLDELKTFLARFLIGSVDKL